MTGREYHAGYGRAKLGVENSKILQRIGGVIASGNRRSVALYFTHPDQRASLLIIAFLLHTIGRCFLPEKRLQAYAD